MESWILALGLIVVSLTFILMCVYIVSGIVEAKDAVKERRKIIPWVWRRKKLQGEFLIKQWSNSDFYVYEPTFNLAQGWYWKRIDAGITLDHAEDKMRRLVNIRRTEAGLPRIYNFEGRLI